MSDDQKRQIDARRKRLARASQHQEMAAKYPAYREFMEWLDAKIVSLDEQWHEKAIGMDELQQLRGQKAVLTEIRQNLASEHAVNLADEMAKLETIEGGTS